VVCCSTFTWLCRIPTSQLCGTGAAVGVCATIILSIVLNLHSHQEHKLDVSLCICLLSHLTFFSASILKSHLTSPLITLYISRQRYQLAQYLSLPGTCIEGCVLARSHTSPYVKRSAIVMYTVIFILHTRSLATAISTLRIRTAVALHP
jgi:hypothetical protein